MRDNTEAARMYIEWVGRNYERLRDKYLRFCADKHYKWDDDIFCDTYTKVHTKIMNNGIIDCTEQGFENYTFLSFRNNIRRESQYARNSKRDQNIGDVNDLYERWFNTTYDSSKTKLLSDLYKDFAALYILLEVENEFGSEHLTLFREKYFNGQTFKAIKQKYNHIQKTREKIIEVKNWVMNNISKKDITKLFEEIYKDFF